MLNFPLIIMISKTKLKLVALSCFDRHPALAKTLQIYKFIMYNCLALLAEGRRQDRIIQSSLYKCITLLAEGAVQGGDDGSHFST
jgi:hypothetical protein